MKEMTHEEIQQKSLEILKRVHNFCVEHNINYSLWGGTLLGAIRHKGFIPWDDDVDIIMPRPDYDRFCKEFQMDGLKMYNKENRNCYIAFTRICDTESTSVSCTYMPWTKEKTGVWIDVFSLDGDDDDENTSLKRRKYASDLWVESMKERRARIPFKLVKSVSHFFILLIKKCLLYQYRDSTIKLDKFCKQYNYENSNHVCMIGVGMFWKREYFPKSDYESYVDVPFEDATFKACNGHIHVLTTVYGDFMKYPPIEEQVPKHNFDKFYWK